MDIKDVSDFPPQVADVGRPSRVQSPTADSPETTRPSDSTAEGYDELRVSAPMRAPAELRKLNEAIEATNLVTEAFTNIGRMLSTIEGTLGFSAKSGASGDSGAVARRGSTPGAGDSIRVELEETLGKTLEIILPSGGGAASGFQAANVSPKDLILDTVAKVEAARKGIEELRSKLAVGIGTLQRSASTRDTNAVSSARLRDEEQVWTVAREARNEITGQPERALGVVGDLQRNAPALLL